jgi:hypothetical protein
MFGGFLERHEQDRAEQLLKLYWNRAGVKRELKALKRERFELLDKLKEQEGAIVRAQEQLEGLERLLTNPLAAANAMVYFQLRHLWRIGAQRVEQFGKELQLQREKRERAQLQDSAIAKRKRRLEAITEKMRGLNEKRRLVVEESGRLEQQLQRMNALFRLFRGPPLRHRLAGFANGRGMLDEKIEELKELMEKIQGEPLPEPEDLSIESRRLINAAVIALAQHLVLHFSEHDLASLAKTATERAVGDMKFGDRRDCDRMVERIRERIEALKVQKTLADPVKKRADQLLSEAKYRSDTDTVPMVECAESIQRTVVGTKPLGDDLTRRATDAPLRLNVLADDYWDLFSVLR